MSIGRNGPRRDNSSGTQRAGFSGGPSPQGEQGYAIRNDEALPSLQTAINKKSAHRYRTVLLRPACLAGVVRMRTTRRPDCLSDLCR
jgi:hypothetical protein